MATTYLDKDAVLKALYDDDGKERQYEYCSELKERIEHGEFDARPVSRTFTEAYQARIYNSPALPDGPWDKLHKAVAENRNLRDRIADLEKLCDVQKATIDAQGTSILDYQGMITCNGCHPKPCSGCIKENESCKYRPYAKGDHICRYFVAVKKEPELFVCPFGKECRNGGCYHKEPHPNEHKCTIKCARYDTFDIKCIPVKSPAPQPSPVPTSGTGTATEGATGICKFASWLDGYVLCKSPDECDYQEGAGFQQQYCGKYPSGSTYPGMAKDIGDLTLRVDNLKIASEAHEQIFRAHGKMIQDLQQKRLMDDSRGNTFEGQIDRLETALEALQEEVAGIKKNPILSTYDPTPRTFTETIPNQYTQTDLYPSCVNCQKYAEYKKQMAKLNPPVSLGGGAIQSPCLSCPNNPNNKMTCSK